MEFEPLTVKQVIVMRKDLNMRRGKQCAQASHASMGALLSIAHKNDSVVQIPLYPKGLKEWLQGSFAKICVSVDSEEELDAIYAQAKEAGLLCCLIEDSGRTEFNGVKTKTCCGIGPAPVEDIDKITGHLKLL